MITFTVWHGEGRTLWYALDEEGEVLFTVDDPGTMQMLKERVACGEDGMFRQMMTKPEWSAFFKRVYSMDSLDLIREWWLEQDEERSQMIGAELDHRDIDADNGHECAWLEKRDAEAEVFHSHREVQHAD